MTFRRFLCVLLLGFISYSVANLCYQCADSTDDEDSASCLHGARALKKMRDSYEKGNIDLGRLPHIKNCSNYNQSFCKIETIQAFGHYNAYIRDCADGKEFSLNSSKFEELKADNQTTCSFLSFQGATVCITLCNGTLCNGPSTGNDVTISTTAMLLALMVAVFMQFTK